MHKDKEKPEERERRKFTPLERKLGFAAAVGVVAVVAGNVGEHIRQDDYIELDQTQRNKLTSLNKQMLSRVSQLPFNNEGYFEQTAENSQRPGFHNTLKIQLKKEGDMFVIDGQALHTGLSNGPSSKSNGQKVPFADPAIFSLAYPLDRALLHTVPAELLHKVMTERRMPAKVDYQLTEKRPSRGRGDSEGMGTRETAVGAVLDTAPTGRVTGVQIGNSGMFANSDELTEKVEEAYGHINDELDRIITP